MKCNRWTLALMIAGLVSLPAMTYAEEKVNMVQTALASTMLSGYVDTSAQWNLGPGNAHVPNYAFGGPAKADGVNLNVVKVTLEKPIDSGDSWAAGYKVDLIYGPDASALPTQSTGLAGDFGVKQAYVSLHAPLGNGLDFKVGVWDTIIGYEVFESINNPNVTRSYGYTMEPTTHTGVLATYQFCEAFSASLGVANTFGSPINQRAFMFGKAESYKTYLASFTITAPKDLRFLSGSTLSGCVINGFNAASPATGGIADQTSWYIGATLNTPVTGLKVGACYDYAGVSQQPLTGDTSGYDNAVGGYASYQATEKLSVSARGEYATSGTPAAFLAERVVEATATIQYDLWKNVLSRLEFRWDHAADGSKPYGGTDSEEPGNKRNSFILLANLRRLCKIT